MENILVLGKKKDPFIIILSFIFVFIYIFFPINSNTCANMQSDVIIA